jgi:hypothetical protein
MSIIVKIIGTWDTETPHDGRYLVSWNSDTRYGDLHCVSTDNWEHAKLFINHAEVMSEWSKVSVIDPKRPDGKPNRPLTALTFEFVVVP